jgi:ribosomal protein S18 acetylase RimI-like enzyme
MNKKNLLNNISIRNAKPDDMPIISELWQELMRFHAIRYKHLTVTEEGVKNFYPFLREHIADKNNSCVLVAEINGEVMGFCIAYREKRKPFFKLKEYGMIDFLGVTQKYRKLGIGEILFEHTKEAFVNMGLKRIELLIATSNEVSTSFWQKLGFKHYVSKLYLDLL